MVLIIDYYTISGDACKRVNCKNMLKYLENLFFSK